MDLDRTHRRILALLESDARISATAIGRAIGLSRQAVQERIAALETQGVIAGYHASVAPEAGLTRALIFVWIAERPCAPALRWLASLDGVLEVQSLAGDLDAVATVVLPDAAALSALNDQIAASPLIARSEGRIVLTRR